MDMKAINRKMREAAQLRQQIEHEEAEKRLTKEISAARMDGYQKGSRDRQALEKLFTHPIAQELIRSAGRELGRAVALKAEENGTPGFIAIKVTEEVWSYIQKHGAPLEDTIRASVDYHVMDRAMKMYIDVPAMTLSSSVSDDEMVSMRHLVQ